MSYPTSNYQCSVENVQSGSSSSELHVAHYGRDHNVNNSSGILTVNNDYRRIIQQARPIMWHIRGSEEEEAEYDQVCKTESWSLPALSDHTSWNFQYGEYRRGDIELLQRIHHETLTKWDEEAGLYVPLRCERSIWLGKIVSGDGKGTIVTVVSYQGQDAATEWKQAFQGHSAHLCPSIAHLLGLNRSKVPQLILLGELVPATVLRENIGQLAQFYLGGLSNHWECDDKDLWMDTGKGVICRGPEGPSLIFPDLSFSIEDPVITADILKEDVLMRYFANYGTQFMDRMFVRGISRVRYDIEWSDHSMPGLVVDTPTVLHALNKTLIAVANQAWESHRGFEARNVLGTGWTR
ncbi:hypothetical protein PQX77_014187 [Marasmius sp. AFHP31]|nr:hypothetical protein PQX77_014187 [Marasmius sp. AFHP31]